MDSKDNFIEKIINLQDENGCWNVLSENDRYFKYNYYEPNFKSTLWTLIFLADMEVDPENDKLLKPLKVISDELWNEEIGIYSLGKSHFPIPCLNGNMLYLHAYFDFDKGNKIDKIIDFFGKYQRFDDGDFKTPSSFPYCSNKSCYGKHTCYWGVIKLFKGLSFIPKNKRSQNAEKLIKDCIDFILLHEGCFSSHNKEVFLHTNIKKLTFPNMYQADFLEILWLLKREQVKSQQMKKALDLLKSKMTEGSIWKMERQIKNLIIPMNDKNHVNEFITKRAKEVLEFYNDIE